LSLTSLPPQRPGFHDFRAADRLLLSCVAPDAPFVPLLLTPSYLPPSLSPSPPSRLLDDPLIHTATQEILPDKRKSRAQIQQEIKRKERAIETFVRAYTTPCLEAEDIRLCLYSICDNNSFLNSNRLPIDKMIAYLLQYFSSSKVGRRKRGGEIRRGRGGGARHMDRRARRSRGRPSDPLMLTSPAPSLPPSLPPSFLYSFLPVPPPG
jgi:hypothetical protein